ncbi:MAG TPA: sigma-70 family RNA polymerase sigma factor [Planctomycetota bacterium]|nr:sigma-70 family RNA polymerase sigma factor [Planctomycetota bacterium]
MSASRDPWARAILEQNRRWLLAWFLAATGDPARAEDLVQDVFTEAVRNAERFDPSKSFGAWLRGIARNLLLMSHRDSRRRVLSVDPAVLGRLDEAAARSEALHAVPDYAELRQTILRECMQALPERSRSVLAMKYGDGRGSREIAKTTGLQVGAVDMLLSRSRRALQDCVSRKLTSVRHG